MPRTLVHAPGHDRHRSLGWLAVAWMEYLVVHGPGDVQGQPVRHGDEFTGFIVDCYALGDAAENTGRLYDSAFLSRPKGSDKSGLGARFVLFEALGPCRFAGWAVGGEVYEDPWGLGFRYVYEAGEPMGRPVNVPFIRCMATEEGQTGNVYDTVLFNLTDDEARLSEVPGLDTGLTRIYLPGGGEITPSTASSASKDGGKETFVVFDETHLYNLPELRRMYNTVGRNLRKRKKIAGTWFLETTTMFAAGEDSTAEATYQLAEAIQDGSARRARLLYDHRWGDCEDLAAEDQLRAAIAEAFGEALEWNDIDGIVDEFYDTRKDPVDSRRYFLNAATATTDAWLAPHEWAGRAMPEKVVAAGDRITLGFDGSRHRSRGITDATALIGCRVSDGHLFEIAVWEQPDGAAGRDWWAPTAEVESAVRSAFQKYKVVGFYADPAADWRSFIANWEFTYGRRLRVRATQQHPIEFWMNRQQAVVRALEQFHAAVINGELSHDGSFAMTRHVQNARRRPSRAGLQIAKEHPDSRRKIDAAVAATLAWQARLDAVSKGLGRRGRGRAVVLA